MRHRSRQQFSRGSHDTRHIATEIDSRIPTPSLQRAQISSAVTMQLLDFGEKVRIGAPAIEKRQTMSGAKGGLDDMASKKLRATDDQDIHTKTPVSSLFRLAGKPIMCIHKVLYHIAASVFSRTRPAEKQ